VADNDISLGDVLGFIASTALLFGAAYVSEKLEEEKMDKLLAMPTEQAIASLAASIPPMNNDTWQLFQSRLQRRAQQSNQARILLYFAQCVVRAEHEVQQIISYSISDAVEIVRGLLPTKDQFQQLALLLGLKTSQDIKARSILGHLLNS